MPGSMVTTSLTATGGSSSESVRQRIPCAYCLGLFTAKRAHATTCSGACREAMSRALKATELDRPCLRRETWSAARKQATGYGLMTRRAAYEADRRVRLLALWEGVMLAGARLVYS